MAVVEPDLLDLVEPELVTLPLAALAKVPVTASVAIPAAEPDPLRRFVVLVVPAAGHYSAGHYSADSELLEYLDPVAFAASLDLAAVALEFAAAVLA